HRGLAPAVPGFAGRDGLRDPPAHLLRRFEHLVTPAGQVTLAEHTECRVRPLANLRRTSLRRHPAPPSGVGDHGDKTPLRRSFHSTLLPQYYVVKAKVAHHIWESSRKKTSTRHQLDIHRGRSSERVHNVVVSSRLRAQHFIPSRPG